MSAYSAIGDADSANACQEEKPRWLAFSHPLFHTLPLPPPPPTHTHTHTLGIQLLETVLPVREQQIRILQGQQQQQHDVATARPPPRLMIKELAPSDSDASSSMDLALSPVDVATPSASVDGRPLLEPAPSDSGTSAKYDLSVKGHGAQLFLVRESTRHGRFGSIRCSKEWLLLQIVRVRSVHLIPPWNCTRAPGAYGGGFWVQAAHVHLGPR